VNVPLEQVLLVAAIMFVCGLVTMVTKRNAIGILIGVELVLNASNLNFVAFSYYTPFGLDGQLFALFGIIMPAAEAAIALAIILNFYNNHMTIDVDKADDLRA